jgi:hypothetical protein
MTTRTLRINRIVTARLAATPVLAAALLVLTAAPVAAVGNTGPAIAGWGYCYNSTTILVSVPSIQPAPVRYGATPLFGTPSQRVAFRANLSKWTGSAWTPVRYGTWFQGTANAASLYGFSQTRWTTLTGQPIPYSIGFDRLASGTWAAPIYYRVWYDLYWYPDQYRPEGSTWAWADGHREDRGAAQGTANLDQTAYALCKYPGPNWLQSING